MGSFSDYAEGKILDHLFRTTTYSQPATLYIGLATAFTGDSSTGSSGMTEANYTSYARVACNPGDSNWDRSAGVVSNHSAITFPTCTGGSNTVTHVFIADASTNGNIIGWTALSVSKTITTNDVPSFAAAALTISLD
jgi:hypothetical protein